MAQEVNDLRRKRALAGRKGGKSKVIKGPRKLSPERRSEIARKAAQARWNNRPIEGMKYEENIQGGAK
jgi:hypothetical protein